MPDPTIAVKTKISFNWFGLERNFDMMPGWLHHFKKHHAIR